MHLSTRGRYAVMAMLDLAALQQETQAPVTLAQIAERQQLSLSYLEQLFAKLRRAGLVKSVRGPGGGYQPAKAVNEIYLGQITRAVEEQTDMTGCGNPNEGSCRADGEYCNAHKLWVALSNHIECFLDTVSLKHVMDGMFEAPFNMGGRGTFMDEKIEVRVV